MRPPRVYENSRAMKQGLKAFVLGDRNRIAGTVYGTIIVMSVLAAGAKPYRHHLWRLLLLVGVSVIVLWLAHVYSHGLGESLSLGRRLRAAELRSIARREYSIVASAVAPLVSVFLGVVGVLTPRTSISLALWIGVLALTVQGVRYAQLERLSRTASLLTIALNTGIGLGLVALEVLIAH
jgi:hypothetical protein